MNDTEVMRSISALVDEEHTLLAAAEHGGLDEEQRQRLHAAQTQLDQCWDLLRQRRAKREFGEDPDSAQVRDKGTVEGYEG